MQNEFLYKKLNELQGIVSSFLQDFANVSLKIIKFDSKLWPLPALFAKHEIEESILFALRIC